MIENCPVVIAGITTGVAHHLSLGTDDGLISGRDLSHLKPSDSVRESCSGVRLGIVWVLCFMMIVFVCIVFRLHHLL